MLKLKDLCDIRSVFSSGLRPLNTVFAQEWCSQRCISALVCLCRTSWQGLQREIIDNVLELKRRDRRLPTVSGRSRDPTRIRVACVFKGQKVTRIESRLGVLRRDHFWYTLTMLVRKKLTVSQSASLKPGTTYRCFMVYTHPCPWISRCKFKAYTSLLRPAA